MNETIKGFLTQFLENESEKMCFTVSNLETDKKLLTQRGYMANDWYAKILKERIEEREEKVGNLGIKISMINDAIKSLEK